MYLRSLLPALWLLIALSFSSNVAGQAIGCDGIRYLNDVFTVGTPSTVQYGQNTTVNGVNKNLMMDVYQPDNDTASRRPVIFFCFGGSFIGGDRAQAPIVDLCRYFARKGYVTVSIDYRLYDGSFFPIPDSTDMVDEVIKAVGDLRAAIRYIREDAATANLFRADTNLVFAGGISAGAILADHAAYLDDFNEVAPWIQTFITNNGGLEGNSSNNYQYSSSIQGVISLSGAIYRTTMIDADDPPFIAIHETNDGIVPYGFGFANIALGLFALPIVSMEGDFNMHQRFQSLGANSVFNSVVGSGHTAYLGSPSYNNGFLPQVHTFLHDIICSAGVATLQAPTPLYLRVFPNPAQMTLQVEVPENGSYQLQVIDNQGKVILNHEEDIEDYLFLQRNDMPAGMYQLLLRPLQAGRLGFARFVWE